MSWKKWRNVNARKSRWSTKITRHVNLQVVISGAATLVNTSISVHSA
jgi:hypothetical protein